MNILFEDIYVKRKSYHPCPICGDAPAVESKKFYDGLVKENGSACVSVECLKCNLRLTEYGRDRTTKYGELVTNLKKNWNRLGAK